MNKKNEAYLQGQEQVKKLIQINILCYMSYLAYSICKFNVEIKNLWVIMAIIPYILVVVSTNFMYKNIKNISTSFKVVLILDVLLRIVSLILNFYLTTLKIGSLNFIVIFLSIIALFIMNLCLELFISKSVHKFEIKVDDKLTVDEQINFDNMRSSARLSLLDLPILFVMLVIVNGINQYNNLKPIIVIVVINIFLLILFLKQSFKRLNLYYIDKEVAKKVFLKENSFVIITLLIGYIYQLMSYSKLINNFDLLMMFVQGITLFPVFKLRYERAKILNKKK